MMLNQQTQKVVMLILLQKLALVLLGTDNNGQQWVTIASLNVSAFNFNFRNEEDIKRRWKEKKMKRNLQEILS